MARVDAAQPDPFEDGQADSPRKPYRSRAGTYECIRKDVLEDPDLTPGEFRVLLYLATKPDGWVAVQKQLAVALPAMSREAIRLALRGLRKKGYAELSAEREGGQFKRRVTRLRPELVLHIGSQVSTSGENVPGGEAAGQHHEGENSPVVGDSPRGEIPHGGESPAIANTVPDSEYGSVLLEKNQERRDGDHRSAPVTAPAARELRPDNEAGEQNGNQSASAPDNAPGPDTREKRSRAAGGSRLTPGEVFGAEPAARPGFDPAKLAEGLDLNGSEPVTAPLWRRVAAEREREAAALFADAPAGAPAEPAPVPEPARQAPGTVMFDDLFPPDAQADNREAGAPGS